MDSSIKKEKLYLDQIQKLSEHTIFGISATLINSLILSLILWNVAPKMSVMIWFFLLISVSLVRLFLQRSYSKAMPELEKAKKWKNWFLLTIAFSGVIWGSAGIFLFPPDSIGHQTFIAFVLGGMVAGSVGVFSVVLTAFLAYSIPALLPIVIMFFSVNDEIHIAMGIMGILFWLIMFLTAKGLNKTITTSLSLKHENVNLISELQDEIEERRKIEKELLRKHEEIEGIVEERTSELRDVNKKLVEEVEVRKNAENAFRESETHLRALINYAPVVLWAIDSGGVFTFSEGKGLEAINLGPGEVIGKSLFEMYGDNEQIVDDARQALSGSTVSSTTKVDGIIFENRYVPIFDEKDSVTGAIGVAIDVTERKRAEEALRESEERYRTLIETSPDTIFSLSSEDGTITSLNAAFEKITGWPVNEWIGQPFASIIRPDDLPIAMEKFQQVLSGEISSPFELHVTSKYDKDLLGEFIAAPDIKGEKVVGVLGFARDITERKQAEEAIQLSKREWVSTFDAMSDWVSLIDLKYRILRSNRAGESFVSLPTEEMIGRTCCELTHGTEEPIPECPMQKMLQTHQRETVDLYMQEMHRWLRISVDPVMDEDENLVKAVHIVRDITELKRMEEERLKSMKLESIGIIAGGIAHDFNNLLSVIMGNIELAEDDIKPEVGISECLAEAEKASIQAQALTKQLITFAKGGAPVKKIGSIGDLIKETTNLTISKSNVKCDFLISHDLWPVEFDEGQMKHAIKNMIDNAVESMPDEGTIDVRAENINITAEQGLPLLEGKYVKISIRDHGVGIPEEHLSKIFDPYFSTKEMGIQKGMGLGLATTYSIINRHDGYITVESEVGVGTTFTLFLPAHEKDIRELKPLKTHKPEKPSIRTGRILVMDDEESIRKLSKKRLSQLGYESELAKDGAQAIELYKKAMDSGQLFDAVILDLTVKGGMGGKNAVKALLKINPQVKAIVSSGYSNDPVMTDFRAYGFTGALPKPNTKKELIEALKNIINLS